MGTLSGRPMGTALRIRRRDWQRRGRTVFLERFWLLGNHERSKLRVQQVRDRIDGPIPPDGHRPEIVLRRG
jgi:hypothetical protein